MAMKTGHHVAPYNSMANIAQGHKEQGGMQVEMGKSSTLVVISFLFFSSAAARRVISTEEDLALERELRMLNKPYVKSFKDKYGVVFDCVDIYKQPAFDHPLLKNHKFQVPPNSYSKSSRTDDLPKAGESTHFGVRESCPDGTVLIRRTLKDDLLRARVFPRLLKPPRDQAFTPMGYTSEIPGEHFALLLINSEKGSEFQAANAVLEVYPLNVQQGQSSSAQILLIDDSSSRASVVQSGWHIDPDREGNNQARLMIYWTADDYHETGCMNMLCQGFVVQSQTTTPGMVLATGSIPLNISKDAQTGNWQVVVGDEIVGYFPKEIINGMSGATEIQMGGIVYGKHGQISPPMGNGFLPVHGGDLPAAKFTWVAAQGAKIAKLKVARDVADTDIYDGMVTSDSSTGPEGVVFQYGGPGGQLWPPCFSSPTC